MLKMDLEYVHEVLFVRLYGNLTRRHVFKINNYLIPVLKKHQIKNLIINCQNLKNIDEAGVDAILHAKCTMKRNQGKIFLCAVKLDNSFILKRLHIRIINDEESTLTLIRGVKG